MDIEEQITASRNWQPGDAGPRPYDPDSASIMRMAAFLESAARVIKQDPEVSADFHRRMGSDPEQYRDLASTDSGREHLARLLQKDPGLELFLASTEQGQEALDRVYAGTGGGGAISPEAYDRIRASGLALVRDLRAQRRARDAMLREYERQQQLGTGQA
ncbi:hypothetical protein [Streptomyces sp. XH2]|uniref:hypothetical protein n=1 Tax=Streptomyces sp. XH2 TaxID=3412483 RepID=UPI003C7E1BF8